MNGVSTQKTALVTGGTRGIGLAIAKALINDGYRVFAAYSKDEQRAEEAKKYGVIPVRADVSKEADVKALFREVGEVSVLVNNAGVALQKQVQDTTYEEWNRLFAVNVGGAFLCTREAVRSMISNQEGVIINISSVWGEVGGSCESAYSATKSALYGFTKALAKELGPSGVRVNCVSPGVIDTSMNAKFSQAELEALTDEIPLGRIGCAEEVANAVLVIVKNGYITGVDLPVNGGFSLV
jgi:3-oxoacyl-[acyl-carrier protein] reductase